MQKPELQEQGRSLRVEREQALGIAERQQEHLEEDPQEVDLLEEG